MEKKETKRDRLFPRYPRVGVGVFVFNRDRILLVKRAQEPALGVWTVPGGLVEIGESLEQTAHRELFEECGIKVHLLDKIDVFEYIKTNRHNGVEYHYVVIEFLAEYLSGELVARSDVEQAQWLREDELEHFKTTEATMEFFKRAVHMRASSCKN